VNMSPIIQDIKILTGHDGFVEFAERVGLSRTEQIERESLLQQSFMPFKVTDYYVNLIASQVEPYKTQMINIVVPPPGGKFFKGRFDPYGNKNYRQDARAFLQHKYEKTLLLHIDNFCISNCQFCYKVNEIRHEVVKSASINEKVDMALDYLTEHTEINNVLLTGGDPASFRRTSDIINLINRLISHENIRIVRFATKGLAYDPECFMDDELLAFFKTTNEKRGKQISIIAQINHPAEISANFETTTKALQEARVQVRGQPAIIKGVNDSVGTLVDLQRKFLDNQIISYYLTVFMPVRGVEQYGIPLEQAFRNVAESKRQLSGLEKKGVLLASHDFGKLEICGFYPSPERPEKIILKWHQAAMEKYFPEELKNSIPIRPEDILILDYVESSMYCVDHVFQHNGLPYINSNGELVTSTGLAASLN
jgi:lysine 2,3-aminomutase